MFQYISLGLLAVTALIVLINILKGLIRGIKKTIGSLAAIIISAVIAAIITAIICNPSSSVIASAMDAVKGLIGEGELADIFAIEELGEAVNYYIAMVAAPFVFLVLYIVLSLIVAIIVGIVVKFIPPHKKPKAVVHRLGGVGVGLVCGLLVSAILLMPIVGVLNIVVSITDSEIMESADGEGELAEIFDGADEDAVYTVYSAGCGWMFDSLASADYNGKRIYLKTDIAVILSVVNNIDALSGDASDFGDEQITALNSIVDNIDKSVLLKHTLAGVLSEMASNWIAGETFLGAEKIDAGELLNPVIDSILGVMATSTEDNIVADMRTLTDILDVFVKHDMLANSDDYAGMLETLSKDGVIAELITVANHNERMSVLSDQITRLSIRALASTIGIPNNADERYDLLMSEIADALNSSASMSDASRSEYVKEKVEDALDKYGVVVDGQAAEHITASIIADLGNNGRLDSSDIKEFFMIYAIASGAANSSVEAAGFEHLSEDSFKIVNNPDGTISIGGVVLENYNSSNYGSSAAYVMGKSHIDIGDAAYLYSSGSMKSSLLTFEDIVANVKKYSDCADPDLEAQKISQMLASAMSIFGNDFDSLGKTQVITKLGELLDLMHDTEIFGETVTADLLKAIFQSKSIRDDLGYSITEADTFTNKLNETAKGENGTYTTTTQTVSDTVDVIDKLNDKTTSKEERVESTKKLLEDINHDNAELLGTMTTPSMMMQYGTSAEKADIVADSVTTLFDNMARFNPDTTTDEGKAQHDAEAHAVNTILQLAMDSADSNAKSLFNSKDGQEEGKTGNTAGEFVDLLANSEVVGDTLIKTVYEDGNTDNPFGVNPTENDKEELAEELNAYYEGNKDNGDEDLVRKLNAIAIVAGIDPIF